MKPRTLLKRPLESAEEQEALSAWVALRRERLMTRLRVAAVVALLLMALNFLTLVSGSTSDEIGRFFSGLLLLLTLIWWSPGIVRKMWTHPRVLAAQRQLLRHRGLAADEDPDSLGDEIERLARRIRKRLVSQDEDDALLVAAERRAYLLLERLARNEDGAATGFRERLHSERVRLRARLEAFRVALSNMEVESLLQADFFAGQSAREALFHAATLLEGDGPAAGSDTGTGSVEIVDTGSPAPRALLGEGALEVVEPAPPGATQDTADLSDTAIPRPDWNAFQTSIAVLPFADLSPEKDQEYFCHGLAEELINGLTRIAELRVIARASSFAFLGGQHDVREIGRTLGVDSVVEGSVRKSGQRLRVTVQLVAAKDGLHLWSKRYDRRADDIFEIQDEITAALVDHLREKLRIDWNEAPFLDAATDRRAGLRRNAEPVPPGPASEEELSRRRKNINLDAYHVYLRARHHWNRRAPTELRRSAELFQDAIDKDPSFALAHTGLADAYVLLGFYSVLEPHESFPKTITAATQALEIEDDLAEAHASLAFAALLYQWDWKAAEKSFRRALRSNPGYTTAHHWYAEFLGLMGRYEEALEETAVARDLDPLSPIVNTLEGWIYYYARRYEDAVPALLKTLELESGFAPAEFWLGLTHLELGELEKAADYLSRAVEHSHRSPMMLAATGRLEALLNKREQAENVLRELELISETSYVPPYYCAGIHASSGTDDAAFDCLERAFEERDNWMVFLRVDPVWDPLRQDPRFRDLVRRVGFVEREEPS